MQANLTKVAGTHTLEWRLARFGPPRGPFDRVVLVWLLTLWMFIAIIIEAVLWALVYLYNPSITVLPDPQTAFYFSMVTFTTLGYGDISPVLPLARFLVYMEAIVGVFYMAILVASLIAVRLSDRSMSTGGDDS